jgi:hypothetical protein
MKVSQGDVVWASFLFADGRRFKERIMGVIAIVKHSFYNKIVHAICDFMRP